MGPDVYSVKSDEKGLIPVGRMLSVVLIINIFLRLSL